MLAIFYKCSKTGLYLILQPENISPEDFNLGLHDPISWVSKLNLSEGRIPKKKCAGRSSMEKAFEGRKVHENP